MKEITFNDHDDFRPNLTPYEMFNKGVYSGAYFRPIYSNIAKRKIKGPRKKIRDYLKNINKDKIYSSELIESKNKYGIHSGKSLEFWEDNGWIYETGCDSDYYGWIGWYCEFYLGRRNKDIDDIQIKRFNSVKSRFGKLYKKHKTYKLSQLLLNWGIDIK